MRSFFVDLKRAICSPVFLIGVCLQFFVLKLSGAYEGLHMACVPVLATLPYSTAWLQDYESGYVKSYLPRSGVCSYILGKIVACGLSGGLLELLGCYLYLQLEVTAEMDLKLIFLSGMVWAMISAVLAAWWRSRYVAYGGAFVIFYILVMIQERYFVDMYYINPKFWLQTTEFGRLGAFGLFYVLGGLSLLLILMYGWILRRSIYND